MEDERRLDAPDYNPRTAWYAVFVLSLAYMIAFLDRQIISLVVPQLESDLGLSDVQISLLQGMAFILFYASAGLVVGWLVDRLSRRLILLAGVLFWSVSCAACGCANGFWTLFAARVGVGAGESAVAPAAASILSDRFPRDRLTLALGVYGAGANLGLGASLLLGGAIIGYLSQLGPVSLPLLGIVKPWQMAFLAAGALGVVFAPLLLTIAEPARRGQIDSSGAFFPPLLNLFRTRARVLICHLGGFGLYNLQGFALLAWSPAYLARRFDLSPGEIGAPLGLALGAGGMAGMIVGGWITYSLERRGLKGAHFAFHGIASALLIPSVILSFLAPSPMLFYIGVGITYFISASSSPQAVTSLQLIVPNELRGRIAAIYVLWASIIGAACGPLLVALITEHVLHDRAAVGTSVMLVVGLAALGSSLFMIWGQGPYRKALAQMEDMLALSSTVRPHAEEAATPELGSIQEAAPLR